jgi:hypothetical protein
MRSALATDRAAITGYGPLEPIARKTVNLTKIATQWLDMLRVAGSLVTNLTIQESRCRLARKICHGTAARSTSPTAKARKTSSPRSAWSSTRSCCGTPATSTPSSTSYARRQ